MRGASFIELILMNIHLGLAGGWDERFLQQESELKRVRSEKTNLEQHILGMEAELETLQGEGAQLKAEVEAQRKVCSGMEQQIETLTAEVSSDKVYTSIAERSRHNCSSVCPDDPAEV